ncbi:MAG: MFS transporter [Desulfobacterales bacterium]|nr:MFS transporter [Desulfobacterales bacterium]
MQKIKNNPMYSYLIILSVCSTAGLQAWVILFDNFLVNTAGLEGYHAGFLQSVREIPGFIAMFAVFALLFIKEHKLAVISILILGIGIFITGLFPTFTGLVVTTLVSSLGFHYFETVRQSLSLQYFDKDETAGLISRMIAVASATSVIIAILVFVGANWLSAVQLYMLFGGFVILTAFFMMFKDPTGKTTTPQKKGVVLKKKYWLFYTLTFMGGARRQIFIAFATFLLVQKFDFSIKEISLLFLLNNTVNYFSAPIAGRIIRRFGERISLSLEYIFLIVVFLSYAFVESRYLAVALYILDHVFFNLSIGITTYFQKIADPQDIAPTAAVGLTINHIAAVVLPVMGGYLWMIDYKIPFFAGAVLAGISLIMTQFIRLKN